jgi:hypothetical protein
MPAFGLEGCGKKLPKLAAFLDEAETDVLAYMTFPAAHRVTAFDQPARTRQRRLRIELTEL